MNSNEISEIIVQQNKGKTIIKLLYTLPILLFGIFILFKVKESLLLGACGIILLVIVAPTYFTVAKHFFRVSHCLKWIKMVLRDGVNALSGMKLKK